MINIKFTPEAKSDLYRIPKTQALMLINKFSAVFSAEKWWENPNILRHL